MKKCPVCGKEWSDATRFCGSCGAKLEDGNIVVPDIVPDDGKEEQRKKTEPVKPSVKKTIEPVRPKTRETAENKKIAEEKEEEKDLFFFGRKGDKKNSRWSLILSGVFYAYSSNE